MWVHIWPSRKLGVRMEPQRSAVRVWCHPSVFTATTGSLFLESTDRGWLVGWWPVCAQRHQEHGLWRATWQGHLGLTQVRGAGEKTASDSGELCVGTIRGQPIFLHYKQLSGHCFQLKFWSELLKETKVRRLTVYFQHGSFSSSVSSF